MGGIQLPHLTNVTKQLLQWCEHRKLFMYASYIRSSDNSNADWESRRTHPDIEWQLADYAYQYQDIINNFSAPNIDLFACRINIKCPTYLSWHRDPDAYAVNAFTISWTNFFSYAFPPFTMILKALRKIISVRATGIMIVPQWPRSAKPWFPLFKNLFISNGLIFTTDENVIISANSSSRNMHTKITLVAGILSGSRW